MRGVLTAAAEGPTRDQGPLAGLTEDTARPWGGHKYSIWDINFLKENSLPLKRSLGAEAGITHSQFPQNNVLTFTAEGRMSGHPSTVQLGHPPHAETTGCLPYSVQRATNRLVLSSGTACLQTTYNLVAAVV